jgi:prepilin-type N-terminal cleavage/methylation domain-containing protein
VVARRHRSSPRRRRAGLTLIEVVIAVAIAALLMGVTVMSVSAVTDASLRSTAVTLSGVMKQAYDRAIMQQRTQRVVLDMDKSIWWLEFSTSPFALSKERVRGEEGETAGSNEKKEEEERSTFDDEKTEVEALLEGGTANFTADADVDAGKPLPLPGDIKFTRIWTGHQEEAFTSGTAYLYFFKSGEAEAALVELSDEGGDIITLEVQPLSGRVKMHRKSMPVPELPDLEDGRKEGDE